MNVLRAGDSALLVETDDLAGAHALEAALRSSGRAGLVEVVPGARSVLVVVDPAVADVTSLAGELPALARAERPEQATKTVDVPVTYDGEDLIEVAELAGISPAEIVARHTGGDHVVAFCGFSPGFAYISGLDPLLHLPRRPSPRTAVPPGSVAIASAYSGVYPRATPGGWRLLGHTTRTVWDVNADPPALLTPGTRVRFVDVS